MDDETKARVANLSNRISGLKTRLKGAGDEAKRAELQERLTALETERDTLRGPKQERAAQARPRAERDVEDEQGARRALTGKITRQTGETPEIAKLIKHAERYGTTEVVQTAIDLGYDFDACVRLQDACDRVDAAAHRKEHPHAPKMKFSSSEDRVRNMMPVEKSEAA